MFSTTARASSSSITATSVVQGAWDLCGHQSGAGPQKRVPRVQKIMASGYGRISFSHTGCHLWIPVEFKLPLNVADLPLRNNILCKQMSLPSSWEKKHFIGNKSYRMDACVCASVYSRIDTVNFGDTQQSLPAASKC